MNKFTELWGMHRPRSAMSEGKSQIVKMKGCVYKNTDKVAKILQKSWNVFVSFEQQLQEKTYGCQSLQITSETPFHRVTKKITQFLEHFGNLVGDFYARAAILKAERTLGTWLA